MANGEIYEKNLSNASGIGSGDYLRTVNSNNESEKINYTLLAKAIVEQWAGSTLAGSAQTVKSAIDALEGVSLDYTRSLTSSDDCNTLTQGVYIFSQSVPQNAPSGVQYGTLIVVQGQTPSASTVYNFQLLSVSGRGLYYRRQQGASGDVFANWTKVATKEEIDLLNSKTTYKSFALTDYFTRNTSTTSDASGRIMAFGNCVTIVLQVGGVAVTSSGGVELGSLTKYAPSAYEVHCVGMIGTGSNGGSPVRLNVATNGNITAYGSTSTTATIRFSVSYITNNV